MDRVDSKHVVVDPNLGAGEPVSAEEAAAAVAAIPVGSTTDQPLPPKAGQPATINPNVVRPTIPVKADEPQKPTPAPTQLLVGGAAQQTNTQLQADGKLVLNRSGQQPNTDQ